MFKPVASEALSDQKWFEAQRLGAVTEDSLSTGKVETSLDAYFDADTLQRCHNFVAQRSGLPVYNKPEIRVAATVPLFSASLMLGRAIDEEQFVALRRASRCKDGAFKLTSEANTLVHT